MEAAERASGRAAGSAATDSDAAVPRAPTNPAGGAVPAPGGGRPPSARITVVYLLSSPHSGSTVLGIALGNHSAVAYAGELMELPEPAWSASRSCACGRAVPNCPAWQRIRAGVEGTVAFHELAWEARRFEGWRALPYVAVLGAAGSRRLLRHAEHLGSVLQAIASETGRSVVVDSSKEPSRGLVYRLLDPARFDVRFVHLVRDGREVVASRTERRTVTAPDGRRPSLATTRFSVLWLGANLVFVLLFGRSARQYLRLRYEDFVEEPDRTLRRLGTFLGVDLTSVSVRVRRREPLPVGHVVAGNRLRLGGPVVVRRSGPPGPGRLGRSERRVFGWIAGAAARILGYG